MDFVDEGYKALGDYLDTPVERPTPKQREMINTKLKKAYPEMYSDDWTKGLSAKARAEIQLQRMGPAKFLLHLSELESDGPGAAQEEIATGNEGVGDTVRTGAVEKLLGRSLTKSEIKKLRDGNANKVSQKGR